MALGSSSQRVNARRLTLRLQKVPTRLARKNPRQHPPQDTAHELPRYSRKQPSKQAVKPSLENNSALFVPVNRFRARNSITHRRHSIPMLSVSLHVSRRTGGGGAVGTYASANAMECFVTFFFFFSAAGIMAALTLVTECVLWEHLLSRRPACICRAKSA